MFNFASSLAKSAPPIVQPAQEYLDRLTNRPTFEQMFDRDYRAALAGGVPLCMAFCDIDQFNLISDFHGPDVGERVILAVARLVRRMFGEACHLARDGQELALLIHGSLNPAIAKLDEARAQFARRLLIDSHTDMPIGRVSFSGGIADVFGWSNPQDALEAAEGALRLAKRQGHNRIVAAGTNGN